MTSKIRTDIYSGKAVGTHFQVESFKFPSLWECCELRVVSSTYLVPRLELASACKFNRRLLSASETGFCCCSSLRFDERLDQDSLKSIASLSDEEATLLKSDKEIFLVMSGPSSSWSARTEK